MATRLPPNSIRLYTSATERGKDLYPVVPGERASRVQTAAWDRRMVTGPVGADAEQLISSWTQDDYSGGFGIIDGNESTDTARIAFGVIDPRRPKSMCLPPLTEEIDPPSWATTATYGAYPLGDVGTQMYHGFENGIAGWDHGGQDWHVTENNWPVGWEPFAPVNHPVSFCGALFVPGGAEGFAHLVEATPASGTLTVSTLADITAVCFGLHESKLWAIDTENNLWQLTTVGAAAGATTLANWTQVKDAFGNDFTLDTSLTPTTLFNYFNAAQQETLWVTTLGQGAYMFNPDEPRWIQATVRPGAHPEWGLAADVFRDGEDLFIVAGGLDLTRFTSGQIEVPLSGMSKDQGVPTIYQGQIVDLNADRSTFYGLVRAGLGVTEGVPALGWVAQQTVGSLGSAAGQFSSPAQVAVDNTNGFMYVADTANSRVQQFTTAGVYSNTISGLTGVTGVSVGPAGNVYVAYTGAIRKYNASLALQWSVALEGAVELATDGTHLFVTLASHLIEKRLCTDGSLIDTWGDTTSTTDWVQQITYAPATSIVGVLQGTFAGTEGTAVGEFTEPYQVAVDSLGRPYTVDGSNDHVVRWNADGSSPTAFVSGITNPRGVCIDAADNVYITSEDGDTPEVRKYNASGTLQWTRNFGSGNNCKHCTTDGTKLLICDDEGEKILVVSCATGLNIGDGDYADSSGSGNGQWGGTDSPYGICNDGTHFYATDPANSRVQKMTIAAGVYVTQWAVPADCYAIAAAANGDILVASQSDDAIYRYTNTGTLVSSVTATNVTGLGSYTAGNVLWSLSDVTMDLKKWGESALLDNPGQIARDTGGNFYVADTNNDRLVKLTSAGVFSTHITELDGITGVAVDSSGNIYVCHSETTLEKFNSSLVSQWTQTVGDNLRHLATDNTNLYATDFDLDVVFKRLCSTGAAVATLGSAGTGNGQYNGPYGITTDGTHLWVVDQTNNRVQKIDLVGAYVAKWTISASARGVALDASGDVLVAEPNLSLVKRYTHTGTAIDDLDTTNPTGIAVATGDVLWITSSSGDNISVWDEVTTEGGQASSDDGEFDTPRGVDVDTTHVYVVDRGNTRVQKLLKTDGSYVAKWGSAGTANGAFSATASSCVLDDSGDLWVADTGNARLQRFSNAGVYQAKFAQSSPRGVGRATGDVLWVSTGTHTIVEWDEELTTVQQEVATKSWLGAWTGTAWCALWESEEDMTPTRMRVSLAGDYALWWGNTDGQLFRQMIPPPFFNPADRISLGEYAFAAYGWMDTIRYDNQMGGWDKIASHAFAMMDYAASDVYVDVSYRTDADQFDSGDTDPPYRSWKRIDHIGRTLMWFDDVDLDPASGLPRREGEPFQWIQFRFEFYRGENTYQTPIWLWHSLHHIAVPQDSSSLTFKIPLNYDRNVYRRHPNELGQTLRDLQTSRQMITLQIGNVRPSNPEWQVFFRGRVIKVNSEFYPGADNTIDEVIVVNFIEVGASNNAHTTLASNTPT